MANNSPPKDRRILKRGPSRASPNREPRFTFRPQEDGITLLGDNFRARRTRARPPRVHGEPARGPPGVSTRRVRAPPGCEHPQGAMQNQEHSTKAPLTAIKRTRLSFDPRGPPTADGLRMWPNHPHTLQQQHATQHAHLTQRPPCGPPGRPLCWPPPDSPSPPEK